MKTISNNTKLPGRIATARPQTVRIGMGQHARDMVVAIKLDASVPVRSQKMQGEHLPALVRSLHAAAIKMSCMYEAGPCRCVLHRQLEKAAARSCVVFVP